MDERIKRTNSKWAERTERTERTERVVRRERTPRAQMSTPGTPSGTTKTALAHFGRALEYDNRARSAFGVRPYGTLLQTEKGVLDGLPAEYIPMPHGLTRGASLYSQSRRSELDGRSRRSNWLGTS
jgi:hypothetical protein